MSPAPAAMLVIISATLDAPSQMQDVPTAIGNASSEMQNAPSGMAKMAFQMPKSRKTRLLPLPRWRMVIMAWFWEGRGSARVSRAGLGVAPEPSWDKSVG